MKRETLSLSLSLRATLGEEPFFQVHVSTFRFPDGTPGVEVSFSVEGRNPEIVSRTDVPAFLAESEKEPGESCTIQELLLASMDCPTTDEGAEKALPIWEENGRRLAKGFQAFRLLLETTGLR